MKGFHSYLKNNNIESWINCLNSEIENLKNVKDYNGIILALINIQTSMYIKGKENMNNNLVINSKNKFNEILKAINSNINLNNDNENNTQEQNEFNEEDIDNALNLIKEKMNIAVKIYNLLYNKEINVLNNLNNNLDFPNYNSNLYLNKTHSNNNNFFSVNNNQNISYSPKSSNSSKYYHSYTDRNINNNNINNSPKANTNSLNTKFFTKLLLKYALKYIQKCSHIEFTLKFLDNDELDISYLKLNDISPEIAQALESLFKNLLKIYERNILSKYFNIYKRKVRKIKFKKGLQLLNKMFERYLINIKSGEAYENKFQQ